MAQIYEFIAQCSLQQRISEYWWIVDGDLYERTVSQHQRHLSVWVYSLAVAIQYHDDVLKG